MSMMIHRAVLRQRQLAEKEKPIEENKSPATEQKEGKAPAPKRKRKPKR